MKRIMMTCAVLFAGCCVGCSTTSKVDSCCGACQTDEACTTGCCEAKEDCCGKCEGEAKACADCADGKKCEACAAHEG